MAAIETTGDAMALLKEFKEFALKGNVIDLAVGVIIGASFGKIVDSLVSDLILPVVSKGLGGLDFSNYYLPLSGQVAPTLLEAKKLGAVIAYGNFITIAINFIILAFIIFVMVRQINKLKKADAQAEVVLEPEAPPPAPEKSQELVVLEEILACLKKVD
jgi:large conductance mechanosensitive channel